MTQVIEDIDVRELEDIFNSESLRCRGVNKNGCREDAAYCLTCPCDGGSTQLCGNCLALLRDGALSGIKDAVYFNPARTCGHSVPFFDCSVRPI